MTDPDFNDSISQHLSARELMEREKRRIEALNMIREAESRRSPNQTAGLSPQSSRSHADALGGEWGGSPGVRGGFSSMRGLMSSWRNTRRLRYFMVWCGLFIVIIAVLAVFVVIFARGRRSSAAAEPTTGSSGDGGGDASAETNNDVDTTSSGDVTLSGDERYAAIKSVALSFGITPDESVFNSNPATPQHQAAQWLAYFDDTTPIDVDNPRIFLQRYGLVVFWYASSNVDRVNDGQSNVDGVGGAGFETNWNEVGSSSIKWMSGADICSWAGTRCRADNLVGLNLTGRSIRGELPYELFSATRETLEVLDLSTNNITGTLPVSVKEMMYLQDFHLNNNDVEGTIVSDLFSLPRLRNLNLAQNWFHGGFPNQETETHAPLETLSLQGNWLTGQLPDYIRKMQTLHSLDLSDNDLSGSIPDGLWLLNSLKDLRLGNNHFEGTISSQIGTLLGAQAIHLYGNQLTGPLPDEAGALEDLKSLYVHSNQLLSTIPESWGGLREITHLSVSNNNIFGKIPDSIEGMYNLQHFGSHDNKITGTIPTQFGLMLQLRYLALENNALTGAVPSEIGGLTKLEILSLQGNNLIGTVPDDVCRLVYEGDLVKFLTDCKGDHPKVACTCCTDPDCA